MPTERKLFDGNVLATLNRSEIQNYGNKLMMAIQKRSRRRVDLSYDDDWAELFQLVQRPVLSVLRHVYGIANVEDQDDLFQEVMLRVYRYHLSYDPRRGPLLPWLYTIARNVKLEWQQKSKFRVQLPAVEQRSSDNIALKLIAEDVLAKLDEEDRYILWLIYNEGYTDRALALDLSIPLTTAKYYLRRAKKRARDILTTSPLQGGNNEK